ncbi:hypothetical protein [Rhodoferax sp.]|uniref:hypothetical protein n=1 Tax=Rhodoferax sp. TaxID=50421 RepID=UPI00275459A7|nr:hypothetical protein [Rhodoferax sp.]
MEDAWIGKVMFVGIVMLLLWGITALLTAKGEGARRIRLTLGGLLALGAVAVVFALGGPAAVIITLAILGAGAWIVKGFKK